MSGESTKTPAQWDGAEGLAAKLFDDIDEKIGVAKRELSKAVEDQNKELLDKLQAEITETREKASEEIRKMQAKYSLPGSEPEENKGRKVNVGFIARFLKTGAWHKEAGFEREIHQNMRQRVDGIEERAMVAGTDSAGGYAIPAQQSGDWIDALRANTVAMKLGATEMPMGLGFPFTMPRLNSDVTASWGGEGEAITPSDATLGQIELRPRTLRAATVVSNLSMEHSAPAVDTIVRKSHIEQHSLGLDLGVLNGSGNKAPRGIIQVASTTVDFGGAAIVYQKGREMQNKLRLNNAFKGSLGWAMHPTVQYDAEVAPNQTSPAIDMARRMFTEGPLENMLGYPFQTSTQMPAAAGGSTGPIIFGDWSECLIGIFKGVEIRVSDTIGDYFLSDDTVIRSIMRCDVDFMHETSFVVGTNYGA